jgi:outer membrane protein OmpA-like peptidoglycan-associated protein
MKLSLGPSPRRVHSAATLLPLALVAISMGGCRDRSAEATPAELEEGTAVVAFIAPEGAIVPPEYADPSLADESTLPMRPLELPPHDFSRSQVEIEPNDRPEEATELHGVPAVRAQATDRDYDHFTFTTEGEPQLWAVEAVGPGVGSLIYRNAARERVQAAEVEPGRWMIANLFLGPGKHWLEVRANGNGGEYTLRAVPLGAPDLRMEREPNDNASSAHTLHFGIPRVGLLMDLDDRDAYRFSLRETEHVVLHVAPPPGLVLRADLESGSLSAPVRFTAQQAGEPYRLQARLPMGDYVIILRSQSGASRTPYRVRIDRLDPYDLPADIEPNNSIEDASPFPRDHVLQGRAGEYGDEDWYELPRLQQQTALRVQVLGVSGELRTQDFLSIVTASEPSSNLLAWNAQDSTLTATLPPNTPLFARIQGRRGEYRARLVFEPGIPAQPESPPLSISVPRVEHVVEAFADRAQRLEIPVTLHNRGSETLRVTLDAAVSHHAWQPLSGAGTLTLEAGKRAVVPMRLLVPQDASPDPVQFAVQASAGGSRVSATSRIFPLCGAPPVDPVVHRPLPRSLEGGFNVAAADFGGQPVGEESDRRRQQALFDGITPHGSGSTIYPGENGVGEVTVELGGERALAIAGITMIPTSETARDQLKDFELLLSADGESFQRVLTGRLGRAPIEHAFTLREPVRARYARLRLLSTHGGRGTWSFQLAEWKVIAAPGASPLGDGPINIADPLLGGHLVWSYPVAPRRDAVLSAAGDFSIKLESSRLNEWVIGFRQNRAAQIDRLEWVQSAATGNRVLSRVDVSVSTESPTGPWTPVGTWTLDSRRGSNSSFALPKPVWARFVRISTSEPDRENDWWRLPQTIRVFERKQDASYRSILGEWGHYAKPAIYESLVAGATTQAMEEVTGNGTRQSARILENGVTMRGRVQVQEDEDWYRITVPDGHNRLGIDVTGEPMLRVAAVLLDEKGERVPTEVNVERGRSLRLEAPVEAGRTYYLHVVEPPRSIALVWDNSGSIGPYKETLYRALARFAERLQPGREFVNLAAFDDKSLSFLLPEWSDRPARVQGALQDYDRSSGSSNAEVSLRSATEALGRREGNTAIVFLTDAASGGYPETAALWRALAEVRPRVFAVELHSGSEAAEQQQLMQSWADASNGHYSVFRTSEDLDVAFERASCYLRRPARFSVTATTTELYDALMAEGRVALQGILFDTGSDRIRAESEPTLREITGMLTRHPDLRMLIEGHTDNVGGLAANRVLSEKRAAAVRAYLTQRGIAASRLESKGYGDTMPAAPNDTPEGRQQNRRVELVRL